MVMDLAVQCISHFLFVSPKTKSECIDPENTEHSPASLFHSYNDRLIERIPNDSRIDVQPYFRCRISFYQCIRNAFSTSLPPNVCSVLCNFIISSLSVFCLFLCLYFLFVSKLSEDALRIGARNTCRNAFLLSPHLTDRDQSATATSCKWKFTFSRFSAFISTSSLPGA